MVGKSSSQGASSEAARAQPSSFFAPPENTYGTQPTQRTPITQTIALYIHEGGTLMPKDPSLSRVLVLGSGPIIIGQAAEFDYSGSQACRALQEEGVEVILINPNPATIMTDLETADRVYLEPLRPEFVAAVIEKNDPRAPPHPGGQAGLNLAMELHRRASWINTACVCSVLQPRPSPERTGKRSKIL